ncbi:MAG: hypothetical protein ONB31_04380 [candidate division KSB1 bacterium]|nr:hypothetical protein [candidate division KSB1 bacterium]MDZ7334988.1 hypothetical protein [candidate division KSB1 bacterium]MDZ7357135.1 hypothetical protein [candidate division KSB1 bacterium]MDZ7400203.1 hypothetical protein [candidate division KSB1 bacterium]
MNFDQFIYSINEQKGKILSSGTTWSRLVLLPNYDARRNLLEQALLTDPNIANLIQRLNDPTLGIKSLLKRPADYRVYGSFYWVIRFLADIGVSAEKLGIHELLKILLWQQMEDGQFMIRYHRQKQQAITLVCITAHLAYCLTRLGYRQSNSVIAAINYIITTQRGDGGWHCDRLKQPGEKLESTPSCPAATVHVARLLAQFDGKYDAIIAPSLRSLLNYDLESAALGCEFDHHAKLNFNKLRYPPHYTGLDILNLVHSISTFAHLVQPENLARLLKPILDRWRREHALRSEKRIPEWSQFDFARKQGSSDWIMSLFIQAFETIYLKSPNALQEPGSPISQHRKISPSI